MKALLRKDFYVLWTGMKTLILLIVVFSFVPVGFQNSFAVLYAAMLPYSALAYDERSRWDQMALSMPYSSRDIVRSKYVLGWLSAGGAFLLAALAQLVLGLFSKASMPVSFLFISFCGSITIMAITLPLMFRFGVEKARFAMILLIALICGGAGALSSIATITVIGMKASFPSLLVAVAPVAAIVINLISMQLAEKWYELRK